MSMVLRTDNGSLVMCSVTNKPDTMGLGKHETSN